MKTKILVIEDDIQSLRSMKGLLESAGRRRRGGSRHRAPRETPNLVLCDVQGPIMDGLEAAQRF